MPKSDIVFFLITIACISILLFHVYKDEFIRVKDEDDYRNVNILNFISNNSFLEDVKNQKLVREILKVFTIHKVIYNKFVPVSSQAKKRNIIKKLLQMHIEDHETDKTLVK